MSLVDWSDELSVNVPQLDEQHKRLINVVNQLHEAITKRRGPGVLRPLFAQVLQYTATHFAAEERYLQQIHFRGLDEHKALHDAWCSQAVDLKDRVESGNAMLTLDTIVFLKEWLTNHILDCDRRYAPSVAPRGRA
jgi:hemerythrin-like metal-binding protein